ncbi:MAG: cation:proton antiporter [Candidatus Thermoplasmatota archaeon]|nr:cation:proton antiporter [Candidatus Thermoplasmatota archaeon]
MDPGTITTFLAIGSIIFIGFFGNSVFNRFRIPDVLILVLLGMVIGPDLLGTRFGLVTTEVLDSINQFKDIFLSAALVIILFDGGLSLDIRSVWISMKFSVFLAVMNFILLAAAVSISLHYIMGIDFLVALTLGSIVGGTTGAVVIPIARKMRIAERTKTMLIMESVMTDVLVIVATLSLISVIKLDEFSVWDVIYELSMKFIVGGAVGFAAGVAWLFVLEKLRTQPLSYMVTIAALFMVAGLVSAVGSSGAVAALAFGLAMGNRKFIKKRLTSLSLTAITDEHIHYFHTEITFFVRTFFFVYLGLSFGFGTFRAEHLVVGLFIIALTAVARKFTANCACRWGDLTCSEGKAVFAMMPRGVAAAVLATLPATQLAGLDVWTDNLPALFLNTTLIVILGTTVLVTIFSFLTERDIDKKQTKDLRTRLMDDVEQSDLKPDYE